MVYQLIGPDDKKLPRCDKHLHLPLREVAAYIKGAQRHICGVTGLMHVASGVGTKSIVIYGGRELPNMTGYSNNINIQSNPPCAPCWIVPNCPYGFSKNGRFHKPCLEMITPEMVWEQLKADLIL